MLKSNYLDLTEVSRVFHPLYMPLIFIICTLSMFFVSERFRLLLKTQNVDISRWDAWKLFNIGLFFNFVIPGAIGGDIVKAYYLQKEQGEVSRSSPYTVIFDRILGLFSLVTIGLLSLLFHFKVVKKNPPLMTTLVLLLGAFAFINLFTLAAFNKKIRNAIQNLFPNRWPKVHSVLTALIKSFEFYAQYPRIIVAGTILSFIAHSLVVILMYITSYAAGAEIPLSVFFFVVPVGLTLAGIPIAPPGGIGVGQAAFLFLFTLYLGAESSIGPTVITIYQFACIALSLQGLIYYLLRKKPS